VIIHTNIDVDVAHKSPHCFHHTHHQLYRKLVSEESVVIVSSSAAVLLLVTHNNCLSSTTTLIVITPLLQMSSRYATLLVLFATLAIMQHVLNCTETCNNANGSSNRVHVCLYHSAMTCRHVDGDGNGCKALMNVDYEESGAMKIDSRSSMVRHIVRHKNGFIAADERQHLIKNNLFLQHVLDLSSDGTAAASQRNASVVQQGGGDEALAADALHQLNSSVDAKGNDQEKTGDSGCISWFWRNRVFIFDISPSQYILRLPN
jgi:hypothetical protein